MLHDEQKEVDCVGDGPALYDPASAMLARPSTPATPAMPLSVEALVSLQNKIVNRNAQLLDRRSKCCLERHIQKLTKAA